MLLLNYYFHWGGDMYNKTIKVDRIELSEIIKSIILPKSLFFDIETTGLNAQYNRVISINTLYCENGTIYINQLFSDNANDEKMILNSFNNILKNIDFIITYNGNSFDLPFLAKRINFNSLDITFDDYCKLDLLKEIRKIKSKITLNNYKLKTVESYFNIAREDTLSGKDIIKLYTSYLLNQKKEYRNLILQHNYEDVLNLPILLDKIINSFDKIYILNCMNQKIIVRLNYNDILFKKSKIIIKFYTINSYYTDYINYGSNYKIYTDSRKNTITIDLETYLYKEKSNCFYYLLNEDFMLNSYRVLNKMKKNVIPIKNENTIYYDNILIVLEKILNSIECFRLLHNRTK